MNRYIDADSLKNAFEKASERMHTICGVKGVEIGAVIKAVDMFPTADVVEVRHGEWKKVSEKYPRYVCTSCNHLYNNKEYKHCPNCGAKMDGERREDNEG